MRPRGSTEVTNEATSRACRLDREVVPRRALRAAERVVQEPSRHAQPLGQRRLGAAGDVRHLSGDRRRIVEPLNGLRHRLRRLLRVVAVVHDDRAERPGRIGMAVDHDEAGADRSRHLRVAAAIRQLDLVHAFDAMPPVNDIEEAEDVRAIGIHAIARSAAGERTRLRSGGVSHDRKRPGRRRQTGWRAQHLTVELRLQRAGIGTGRGYDLPVEKRRERLGAIRHIRVADVDVAADAAAASRLVQTDAGRRVVAGDEVVLEKLQGLAGGEPAVGLRGNQQQKRERRGRTSHRRKSDSAAKGDERQGLPRFVWIDWGQRVP